MNTTERLIILNRIRKLSRLMDTAIRIPVIGFRIGLDPIIGLVPGAGDLISTAFSAYIIYLATRFRLPAVILRQMIFNITLEAVVGTVPFIGDLFDAFYKSNVRNLALLEQHLRVTEPEIKDVDLLNLSSADPVNFSRIARVSTKLTPTVGDANRFNSRQPSKVEITR
ncbi:MAG: DUF4112 domain-containing protein [Cyanobacteria bacterium CRU_2_1]|nr:DUF4112 domain-containing protein [Cyanobacteria bacterium RU_5_0]NJR62358.1 DUF4112 domain-containing protein [Cyanobacteria bacterium CRU_2_1]